MNQHPGASSHPAPAGLPDALRSLVGQPLMWLLAAIPLAVGLELAHVGELWVFIASAVAIIPLAGLMGRATENLAETLGAAVGGLLNATFGNAAELIIALIAISKGPAMYPLVKASITGSIIGNVLLVLGLSILLGGLKFDRQQFNRTAASMGATLLALAAIGLLMPTMFFYQSRFNLDQIEKTAPAASQAEAGPEDAGVATVDQASLVHLSEEIAGILAFIYLLSLVFSLRTHQHLFAGPQESLPTTGAHHQPEWSRTTSITMLVISTAGVAWMSELLVGSVEHAGHALSMNAVFVGVIVVAVIGNAAEHSTAVLVAMKDKMDLAVNIAVGSGIQIALFVAPVLVFASLLMNDQPLDLHFTVLEMVTVILAVGVLALVCQDGETHWMEGVMLLGVYVILGLGFYHLPSANP